MENKDMFLGHFSLKNTIYITAISTDVDIDTDIHF